MKHIYLAGGCFWGVQKFFDQFEGVVYTETGYANGPSENPSYRDVCASSGHAETVHIGYDDARISLAELLDYYFMVIDPLSVNRQGNDSGIQYRTGIYYTEENQLPEIEAVYAREQEKAGQPLAVELTPLRNFYSAEEYHQKYLDKNPYGYCHIPSAMFSLGEQAAAQKKAELRSRIGDLAYEVTPTAAGYATASTPQRCGSFPMINWRRRAIAITSRCLIDQYRRGKWQSLSTVSGQTAT